MKNGPLAILLFTLTILVLGCTNNAPELGEKDCTGSWVQGSDVLKGTWSGSLDFEQVLDGETKHADLDVRLEFTARSSPKDHLIALGFTDQWRLYAADADFDDFSLTPLFESGSSGEAFAYQRNLADGPANLVTINIRKVCIKDNLVLWSYSATYKLVDLVDSGMFDYTNPSVSQITMSAQEQFEIRDGKLIVSAEAKSHADASTTVSLKVSGILSPSD